ncbi:MAG: hypothetical protein AAF988_05635 [Pseudomonadota bacterium]
MVLSNKNRFVIIAVAVCFSTILLVGFNFLSSTPDKPATTLKQNEGSTVKEYLASNPSFGPLLTVTDAQLFPVKNKLKINAFPEKVIEGQKIIFFSKEGDVLGYGTVKSVRGNQAYFTFDNPELAELDFKAFQTKADIVIKQTGNVRKIGLSSVLTKDGKDSILVLKAPRDSKGKAIALKQEQLSSTQIEEITVDNALKGAYHIEAPLTLHPLDLVILNPDHKLENGKEIKVSIASKISAINNPQLDSWFLEEERLATLRKESLNKMDDCAYAAAASMQSLDPNAAPSGGTCGDGGQGQQYGGLSMAPGPSCSSGDKILESVWIGS